LETQDLTAKTPGNVFVCGLHRSGTTMLTDAIASHPEVACFKNTMAIAQEGQFLQNILPTGQNFGGAGRFAFDPRSHMTEHSPFATQANAAAIAAQWAQYHQADRRWLVEKSPPNLLRTRLLQSLFPTAHFIIVTRHPIAVAMATQKWTHTSPFSLIAHWQRAYEILAADRPHLRHVMMITYEAFVAAPWQEMDRIWQFLDLPPHPTNIEIHDRNQPYFDRWLHALSQATLPSLPPQRSLWQALCKKLAFSTASAAALKRLKFGRNSDTHDAIMAFDHLIRVHGYSLFDLFLSPSNVGGPPEVP
jgi:hypothetical protein